MESSNRPHNRPKPFKKNNDHRPNLPPHLTGNTNQQGANPNVLVNNRPRATELHPPRRSHHTDPSKVKQFPAKLELFLTVENGSTEESVRQTLEKVGSGKPVM